jgi:hypothetical protein
LLSTFSFSIDTVPVGGIMAKPEEKKSKNGEESREKPHVCTMCARPSDTVICLQCEAKVRGEVLEHQKDVNKAGRTDTGRR